MSYDPGTLYVDPILTNFSVGWADETLYADRLAPETPVRTQSGRYRVYDRSHWLIYRSRREPATEANTIQNRKWSEDTFKTQEHSLQAEITEEERQELNSQGGLANDVFGGDLQIDPERDATEDVIRSIQLERELKVATLFRDTAQYPGSHTVTLAGAQKWSDYTYVTAGDETSIVSNPVGNLKTAFQRIYLDTGRWPNTLIVPFDATGVIENHPRVYKRFQNFALTDPTAWQKLMGLPDAATANLQIFVVDSKYNSADNVDDTESIVSFWGQDVWVGLVDRTPGQRTMTFAKTFAQIYPNGTTKPTDSWYVQGRKVDIVRTSYKYDIKIVSGVAGYLIKNAVAVVS